jgi:acyl-CoA oxidase
MPDVLALRAVLDGDHAAIRDRVRAFLTLPELEPVVEIARGDYRELVLKQAKMLAAEGGTSLGFPSQYGGGDDIGGSLVALETLAHGDLSLMVKCGVQFGLFGGAILHLGSKHHHDDYLRDMLSLDLPGCFAMTETGHGSNVQSLRTTATYDPVTQEFLIDTPDDDARKDYIGNAGKHGRMAAVFAQLVVGGESHGVHCLLVPIRTAKGKPCDGVRIEDCGPKLGLNGVDNGRIWFDGVRVPRENMLDRYAQVTPEGEYRSAIENPGKRFFTMLGTLIQGRVCIAGASNSAAKNALTIATRYATRRRQFGPPDGDEVTLMTYPTHKLRLLPRIATSFALHFAQAKLVTDLHESFASGEDDRRVLESDAAGLKALASWHARDAIQVSRECCGGAGYLAENRFAALKADTDVFTTFEGDNVVLLQLVGKSLLTNYQHEFGSLDAIGTARFVAAQVLEVVGERTAVRELIARLADDLIPGRDEGELDHEVELALLEWRAEHILSSLARRLKGGIDDGGDPFEVFMACQDHVVAAGRAHVEHHVLECFTKTVDACPDEHVQHTLSRLCHLYALWLIVLDRGWFQEHGRLSSTRSKAVQKAGRKLCEELAPQAEDLVAAFGIPDAALAAPIAGV